jgi:hypothetical protein
MWILRTFHKGIWSLRTSADNLDFRTRTGTCRCERSKELPKSRGWDSAQKQLKGKPAAFSPVSSRDEVGAMASNVGRKRTLRKVATAFSSIERLVPFGTCPVNGAFSVSQSGQLLHLSRRDKRDLKTKFHAKKRNKRASSYSSATENACSTSISV